MRLLYMNTDQMKSTVCQRLPFPELYSPFSMRNKGIVEIHKQANSHVCDKLIINNYTVNK